MQRLYFMIGDRNCEVVNCSTITCRLQFSSNFWKNKDLFQQSFEIINLSIASQGDCKY